MHCTIIHRSASYHADVMFDRFRLIVFVLLLGWNMRGRDELVSRRHELVQRIDNKLGLDEEVLSDACPQLAPDVADFDVASKFLSGDISA